VIAGGKAVFKIMFWRLSFIRSKQILILTSCGNLLWSQIWALDGQHNDMLLMVKTCMTTFKVSRFLGSRVHRFRGFITHQFTGQHVIIMATGVESHHHAKISTSTHFPILWKSSISVDVLVAGQYHTCCYWRWWSDTLWVRHVRLQLHSFLTFHLGFDGSDTTGTFIVFCFSCNSF
jgi:hypothetical protein